MNALIVAVYLALCVLLFQICRVPFNRWTAPAALLGGILLVGGSIVALDRYHPYTGDAQPRVSVVPVATPVAGTIIEVAVEEGQSVRRGELLFRVDPEPLQLEVRALESRVAQAQASLKQASTDADRELAQARLGENQARLSRALYRLGLTGVRAPADGRVTGLGIVPGQSVATDSAPVAMRLVDVDATIVVARLATERIAGIAPGAPAEVAFDAIPGRVFAAELTRVAPPAEAGAPAALQLRIVDPGFDPATPVGAAQAALYGPRLPGASVVRKLLLRMAAWIDFVHPYG